MQQGYVFTLAFFALALYNGVRAWFNLNGEMYWLKASTDSAQGGRIKLVNGWNQRIVIGLACVFFCLLALGASAYMGYTTWREEQRMQQEAQVENAESSPVSH